MIATLTNATQSSQCILANDIARHAAQYCLMGHRTLCLFALTIYHSFVTEDNPPFQTNFTA